MDEIFRGFGGTNMAVSISLMVREKNFQKCKKLSRSDVEDGPMILSYQRQGIKRRYISKPPEEKGNQGQDI